MTNDLIPVTVLTGFLGAGKTTLLNHILKASPTQIAVIENEFGPVNIDGKFIKSAGEIVEITNGCLCCTVLESLAQSLKELWQKRATNEIDFSRIIIETTGLADPGPILQTFFADSKLLNHFMLDGVITLVDAKHYESENSLSPVLHKQIANADRLIVTKADLVQLEYLEGLINSLSLINPKAKIINSNHGEIELAEILDIQGFNLDDKLLGERINSTMIQEIKIGFRKKLSGNQEIIAKLLEYEGDVDLDRISDFVQKLIDDYGDKLIRYKGILALPDEPRKLLFQGVQRIAGFDYGDNWGDDREHNARCSKIVLIGFNLPFEEIQEGFKKCLIEN